MKKHIDSLSFAHIFKKIAALALPMAGSQLLNVASGFLCMAMLAQLGHQVLAASALISTTQMSIMVSGMSMLFSLGILISHAYGAKELDSIHHLVQQGWIMGLIISIPIMLLFWNMGSLMLLLGQSKAVSALVQTYFRAYVWTVIPGFLASCNMQLGYAVQKQMLMVVISALSVAILLLSAYALIFGKWGMPALGVTGLAYATTIQYMFFLLFSMSYFFFHKEFAEFQLFHFTAHKHWDKLKQIMVVGWPICMQMGGEMFSLFVSGILIGWLGTTALAAFQVVNQYYFLVIIPIFTLSQASGILVGHAKGAGQFQHIKKISHASMSITLIVSLLVAAIFLIFPNQLASFYMDINSPHVSATLKLTKVLFTIIAFSYILDAIRNVCIGILRGLLDTKHPMILNLIAIWIFGMPLSYVLAFPMHFGAVGFVFGGMIGMLAAAMMMIFRWRKFKV